MSVKKVVEKQYRETVNRQATALADVNVPKPGWIRTVRTALGMSVAQLSRRMGVTRAAIYKAEDAEPSGGLTLRRMGEIAEAMNCRFVYGMVPMGKNHRVEDLIEARAHALALKIVKRTGTHMALEAQSLTDRQLREECERLARKILADRPSTIWDELE